MSTLGIVLTVVLILVLFGGFLGAGGPGDFGRVPWAYGYGFHHGGIGVVGVLLIIVLFLAFTNRL
jgi:ABC-type methionine transport system permease subunit